VKLWYRERVRLALALALLATMLAPPASAQEPAQQQSTPPSSETPPDDAPARALALHDEARQLYARGRYREAVAKLDEAVGIDPDAKVLYYNLGLIHERLGDLDRAVASYRKALELEQDEREKVNLARIIKRLEGAKAAGDLAVPAPPPLPPVTPEPQPAPSSGGTSPWVWVGVGTSATAALIAVILASRAHATQPDDPTTQPGVSVDDLEAAADDAHRLAVGADVALGIGVVAGVTTVVVALATSGAGGEEQARGPSMEQGRLSWRF
jgi:tetratricopeptide (TPR) repeat protein